MPDFSNPDAVDQTNGKIIDLVLNSQPFTIKEVEHLDDKAKVTVNYEGDKNDNFTALFIPPFDLSKRKFTITTPKCMLFRSSIGTSDKVETVTKDIFVDLTKNKNLQVISFDQRNETELQFIIQSMSRWDQITLLPRMHWKNLWS